MWTVSLGGMVLHLVWGHAACVLRGGGVAQWVPLLWPHAVTVLWGGGAAALQLTRLLTAPSVWLVATAARQGAAQKLLAALAVLQAAWLVWLAWLLALRAVWVGTPLMQ